jgi:hypothetical protein
VHAATNAIDKVRGRATKRNAGPKTKPKNDRKLKRSATYAVLDDNINKSENKGKGKKGNHSDDDHDDDENDNNDGDENENNENNNNNGAASSKTDVRWTLELWKEKRDTPTSGLLTDEFAVELHACVQNVFSISFYKHKTITPGSPLRDLLAKACKSFEQRHKKQPEEGSVLHSTYFSYY